MRVHHSQSCAWHDELGDDRSMPGIARSRPAQIEPIEQKDKEAISGLLGCEACDFAAQNRDRGFGEREHSLCSGVD